jgi:hypothetical protein
MSEGELILYASEDGRTKVHLRADGRTVWLTQLELAELFATTKQNVSLHIVNVLTDGELAEKAVVKESLTTAADGKAYRTKLYNLDMILAVGFRVRSARGVQFRRWAATVLKDYMVKGFAMDDARLKDVEQADYFDELLARIKDIRSSEKRFYQKLRDLFATAVDYDKTDATARLFFQKIQNKLLWAVSGSTAAELIAARSNSEATKMGLTSWSGGKVRKGDVAIAKNYLNDAELAELNRIVAMYLDFAEDQATRRKTISMADWLTRLDAFLQFNERSLLEHAGTIQMKVAEALAHERFEAFDAARRKADALAADIDDIATLEALGKSAPGGGV